MFLQHCTHGRTIAFLIAMTPSLALAQSLASEGASEKPRDVMEVASAANTTTALDTTNSSNAGATQKNPEKTVFSTKFGKAADAQDLGNLRGGTDVVVSNDQKLKGTVTDNSATNVATGANNITSGAFSNVSGIPIVIQNSGANVLIQNSTIINLQLH
ncbi:hypothetical protein [Undibacterium sp.]|jgi:hypothetical protein|uniref:hypothetical protein n=1 Tax=Undibacterium sp. TaxID=1914977 RepID=UPI002BB00135|nr:hypothetical protein [Undibacterium sp.]HTD05089.1 hypothetical protein [Undibacterium sp.]